jgi:hypothetical protein
MKFISKIKIIFILIFFILTNVSLCLDLKFGYIDKNGKYFIEPQFSKAEDFKNGFACVKKDGRYFFIDRKGKFAFGYFEKAKSFSEGLAAVEINQKWGYINKNGKVVIKPIYQRVTPFSDGLAGVSFHTDENIWFFIDYSGKTIITEKLFFSLKSNFGDGKFDWCPEFSNGLAAILHHWTLDDEGIIKYECGYMDKTGKKIIEPKFDFSGPFKENKAFVNIGGAIYNLRRFSNGRYGFINKNGKYLIKPKFHDARSFSEGLAAVKNHTGKWQYINEKGEIVINPNFDWAFPFSEGLGRVKIGEKHFFINKKGEYAFTNEFEYALDFSEGYAFVIENGKWSYIKKNGIYISIPQTLFDAFSFSEGLALVCIEKESSQVDNSKK